MDDKPTRILTKLGFLSDARRLAWYPPFWMLRPKLVEQSEDWRKVRIKLPLTWASKNAAGNMFGGVQANLADPIPAIACVKNFPGYRVATKYLALNFLRVGNSDLTLHFDLGDEQVVAIEKELKEHNRATPCFEMTYVRADGHVCTKIRNTIAIRPIGYVGRHEPDLNTDKK
jgi:acyl-coenzyme A thioesterase PaaI-like protein